MNRTEVLPQDETPQILWPKGPLRRIRTLQSVRDVVAGEIALAVLEVCGHEAHLVPTATAQSLVRCSICFYAKRGEPMTEG